ncbi:hypothetical protein JZ751_017056, partial [Albula glossodonta]
MDEPVNEIGVSVRRDSLALIGMRWRVKEVDSVCIPRAVRSLVIYGGRFLCSAGYVRSLEVTVSQSSIQVARGQTALLPCTFTTSAALNSLNIIWMVTPLSNAHQPMQGNFAFGRGGQDEIIPPHSSGGSVSVESRRAVRDSLGPRCTEQHSEQYAVLAVARGDECSKMCTEADTPTKPGWCLAQSPPPGHFEDSPRDSRAAQLSPSPVQSRFLGISAICIWSRRLTSLPPPPPPHLILLLLLCATRADEGPQTRPPSMHVCSEVYRFVRTWRLQSKLSGRVGFAATMPSTSASIFINNTQLSDTGTYQCVVNNLPDRGGRNIGLIGLTVLGTRRRASPGDGPSPSVGSNKLANLLPPSIPSCRIQGSLDVGSDIMLMCASEEGIPTPTYAWEKLESVPKLPSSAMQDQMQGTVTLRNISVGNSGLYQCTASNAIGKSTCLLNLQVVAPQPQSVGLIAGTIATGVLAVIICSLLVVVTLFYWRNKNKYEEDEIPNEIREDDLPPKRSSSVKAFHADASSSENDTLTSTNTYNSRYWHNPKPNYDTNSYTRYNGDTTRQTFSASGHTGGAPPPASRPAYANGSHTLPPPKTLVVTTNSAPSPPAMVRSNGSISLKPVAPHGQHAHGHTHSYAVSQATLERMGAVPVMVPAQSRAGSL